MQDYIEREKCGTENRPEISNTIRQVKDNSYAQNTR